MKEKADWTAHTKRESAPILHMQRRSSTISYQDCILRLFHLFNPWSDPQVLERLFARLTRKFAGSGESILTWHMDLQHRSHCGGAVGLCSFYALSIGS